MHVIRSSLSRLGRGDLGATLDLRDDEEFRELGDVFDQVSAQLRAASPEGLKPAQLAELSRRIVDGRPADRRRRARDEEPAQRDDHSPRAAASRSWRPEQSASHARRGHRAGDPPARRAHPGLPEVRAARRGVVRPGRDRAAAGERARRGRSRKPQRAGVAIDARLHRRRAARGRRRGAAARRVPEPRAERDPGHAQGRPADDRLRGRGKPPRPRPRRRYRGRHSRPRT